MGKIKKGWSVRISLFVSVGLAIIIAQLLYMGALTLIDNAMLGYMDPQPDTFVYKGGNLVAINYGPVPSSVVEITDIGKYEALRTIRALSPIIIYGICLIIAATIFYTRAIMRPLKVLNMGVEKIASRELDFQIDRPSNDELGRLCGAFETMRSELQLTFEELWKSEENQRSMYRAFAHDLRTPLTVIKGNNEIVELVAAKNNDWERAVRAVQVSNGAVSRIERYADQIKELEHIGDGTVDKQEIDMLTFLEAYRQQAELVAQSMNRRVQIVYEKDAKNFSKDDDILAGINDAKSFSIDQDMLTRILDNLLTNGLEHAEKQVTILFTCHNDFLEGSVCDDGDGFSHEALRQATTPFFTTDKEGGHMGIGLAVVQKLVDKMQGTLLIENQPTGGVVKFFIPV
ncbi:MAG: HAMP domain-containing histidine kinase [Lachnospiraceae bacterium]|jgi:signal transduction histidine kinase|nr:HAMP domain-containing histidine kinase [Lachnospiraceae bacterium]